MAKNKKTGGRDWKKGESGNRSGYQGLTDIQLLKHRTRDEILRAMCSLLMSPMKEVEAIARNMAKGESGEPEQGNERCAEVLMANVISMAAIKGCPSRLNYLFQHIIGRPQTVEEIDVEAAETASKKAKQSVDTIVPDIASFLGDALPHAEPSDLMHLFNTIKRIKANAGATSSPVS